VGLERGREGEGERGRAWGGGVKGGKGGRGRIREAAGLLGLQTLKLARGKGRGKTSTNRGVVGET